VTGSSDTTPQPADQTPAKKPYSKPRLEVYGDLRKITNNVGLRGVSDNRFFPFIKTAR
jgi:hypothetical protein